MKLKEKILSHPVFQDKKLVESLRQAFKFALVGVLNTLVGWAAFSLFFYLVKLDFRLANIISYALGLINSFIFNKLWTFQSKKYKASEIFWFICIFVIAFGTQYFLSLFLKDTLHWHPFIAFVAGNVVYTVLGFLGNKLVTFRKTGN